MFEQYCYIENIPSSPHMQTSFRLVLRSQAHPVFSFFKFILKNAHFPLSFTPVTGTMPQRSSLRHTLFVQLKFLLFSLIIRKQFQEMSFCFGMKRTFGSRMIPALDDGAAARGTPAAL